jgi:hypothetical protein
MVRYSTVPYRTWKEYGTVQYGTISYGMVPEIPFSQEFWNPKNRVSQDPGPRFLDPLISRARNSESKEAHWTTSELAVFPSFSARFHRERAWPFRVDKNPQIHLEAS